MFGQVEHTTVKIHVKAKARTAASRLSFSTRRRLETGLFSFFTVSIHYSLGEDGCAGSRLHPLSLTVLSASLDFKNGAASSQTATRIRRHCGVQQGLKPLLGSASTYQLGHFIWPWDAEPQYAPYPVRTLRAAWLIDQLTCAARILRPDLDPLLFSP